MSKHDKNLQILKLLPIVSLVINLPSGNPGARFVFKTTTGLSSFGLAGAKSAILVFQTDAKYDIQTSLVVAADEFLLYDYPPGSNPKGKGKELARQLKNTLEQYVLDNTYCQQ